MNLGRIKYWAGRQWHNIPGWRTRRKIVVFESDDWGSIRMPSKEVYEIMLKKGYPVDKRTFERYDALESAQDLQLLFGILSGIRDITGNHPVFTANFIMTNPDFGKIKDSDYKEYYGEEFISTYCKYPNTEDSLKTIQKGISERLFHPQYHGYSHFNYFEWMSALQTGSKHEHFCFKYGMVGVPSPNEPEEGNILMDALRFKNLKQLREQRNRTIEGVRIFKSIFGYRANSFIAPVYTWNSAIESDLANEGVCYIQGGRYQKEPKLPDGKVQKKKHYIGEKNSSDQFFLVRNAYFEPATNNNKDWIEPILMALKAAFRWSKPAIISTHRLNYIGRIHPENRDRNLRTLEELLKRMKSNWPDVEFMTSDQLGALIAEDYNENRHS